MMENEFYKEVNRKSKKNYDRYRKCKLLEDIESGELIISTLEPMEIPYHTNDIYYRVVAHEVSRLDILAHKYYQNPILWWVIALANDIVDPFIPLEPGTLVRIPAVETLYGYNGILL